MGSGYKLFSSPVLYDCTHNFRHLLHWQYQQSPIRVSLPLRFPLSVPSHKNLNLSIQRGQPTIDSCKSAGASASCVPVWLYPRKAWTTHTLISFLDKSSRWVIWASELSSSCLEFSWALRFSPYSEHSHYLVVSSFFTRYKSYGDRHYSMTCHFLALCSIFQQASLCKASSFPPDHYYHSQPHPFVSTACHSLVAPTTKPVPHYSL